MFRADSIQFVPMTLQQGIELVHGQLSSLEDMGKRPSFDGTMGGNGNLQNIFACPLLQTDMTSSLPNDDKTGTLKRFYDSVERQTWELAHKMISLTSLVIPERSSSTGSR